MILPLFVVAGSGRDEEIELMPGVRRLSVDLLKSAAAGLRSPAVIVFGVPESSAKDGEGSGAVDDQGIVPTAVRTLKEERPDLVVITDVCLCAYTNHGHCGVLTDSGEVANDESIAALARMATVHAAAGADMVGPSANMDGQVAAIRESLDRSGFVNTAVMAYAAKFASSFYGPFREAAHSAPDFGDRKAYQIPCYNGREAIRDALLDEKEGADWLMVKPAMPYLDVLSQLKGETRLPLAAYQVSGEYAMLKIGSKANLFDERSVALESLACIKRAGADAIITYYAEEACKWMEG